MNRPRPRLPCYRCVVDRAAENSLDLAAHMQLLLEKREKSRAERERLGLPVDYAKNGHAITYASPPSAPQPDLEGAQRVLYQKRAADQAAKKQAGLAVEMRTAVGMDADEILTDWMMEKYEAAKATGAAAPKPAQPGAMAGTGFVKVFPFLEFALNRSSHRMMNAGRLRLLHKHMTQTDGIDLDDFIAAAETVGIGKQRHVTNLLRDYDGVLWEIGGGRVWRYSEKRVAMAIDLEHINGRPVAFPINALGDLKQYKAAMLEALYSCIGDKERSAGNPISRVRLEEITGFSTPYLIQLEEMRGRISKRKNIAIVRPYNDEKFKTLAYDSYKRHGRNILFKLTDYLGLNGPPGHSYIAQRMPNSYEGDIAQLSLSSIRRINHQLHLANCRSNSSVSNDDVLHYMQGNGELVSTSRYYFDDGKRWAREASSPHLPHDLYHFEKKQSTHTNLWSVVRGNMDIPFYGPAREV